MDFVHRIAPNQSPAPAPHPVMPESVGPSKMPVTHVKTGAARNDMLARWGQIATLALVVIIALLIGAVAWLTYSAAPASPNKYVDSSKLQAVFLNSGQVYFGHISSFNKDYLVLTNIYYLQSSNSNSNSSSSQSNQNVSLVKLGCELHKPYDEMVVSTSQVTFWENLQGDGQVAKAVAQFQQQNPNGQNCSNQPASSSNSLQNSSSSSTKQ